MGAKEKKLDARQQQAVDSHVNTVVLAGAGSGKTTVLTERFLSLVRSGKAQVNEILTLTFTRKAAAEMYERIYMSLAMKRKEGEPLPGEFEEASISTIDSFCSRIVKSDSGRYGLPANFSVQDPANSGIVEEAALSFLIKNSNNRYLQRLTGRFGFERVWKELFASLGNGFFSLDEPYDFGASLHNQISHLEKAFKTLIDDLQKMVAEIIDISLETPSALAAKDEFQKIISAVDSFPEGPEGLATFITLCNSVQGVAKPRGKASEALNSFKEIIDEIRQAAERGLEIALSLKFKDQVTGTFKLLRDFEEHLAQEKRRSGAVSFNDIMRLAVAILRDNHELRQFYKKQFKFIMIDEFQDNNVLQKELLYLLAEKSDIITPGIPTAGSLEPGKLFFVGDEKQSVYRFRGADVRVFKGLSKEIENNGGAVVSLPRNYRSAPGLIVWFNKLFQQVMHNSTEEYEARFEPLEPRPEAEAFTPRINFFYFQNDNEDNDALGGGETEAFHLAKYIQETVTDKGLTLPNGRAATYGDFAILMRSTANQLNYEKMLRLFQVPYHTNDIHSLFLEAPGNDLFHFLNLLIYPDDKLSYAAVLRSPFVNLSDQAFSAVLMVLNVSSSATVADEELFRYGVPDELPLQTGMGTSSLPVFPTLGEKDQQRLRQARQLYEKLKELVDRRPHEALLRLLWFEGGYRYHLLKNPGYHNYLDFFDYLVEIARQFNGQPLASLLAEYRNYLGQYTRFQTSGSSEGVPGDSSGVVQLLTVHKSKGLEFPVVILASAAQSTRGDSIGNSLYHVSEKFGVTVNLPMDGAGRTKKSRFNYFFSLGEEESRKQEEAELKRLLYVAVTRAESHLIVSGWKPERRRRGVPVFMDFLVPDIEARVGTIEKISSEVNVIYSALPPVSQSDLLKLHRPGSSNIAEMEQFYATAETVDVSVFSNRLTPHELNAFMPTPGKEKGLFDSVIQLPSWEIDDVLRLETAEASFGTEFHKVIEGSIARYGLSNGKNWRISPSDIVLGSSFPEKHRKRIAEQLALTVAYFPEVLGRKIDKNPIHWDSELEFVMEVSAEESISGNMENRSFLISGAIDLCIEYDDFVVVIDYKTDRTRDAGRYEGQLSCYKEAVNRLYPEKQCRVFLWYVREPELIEVVLAPFSQYLKNVS